MIHFIYKIACIVPCVRVLQLWFPVLSSAQLDEVCAFSAQTVSGRCKSPAPSSQRRASVNPMQFKCAAATIESFLFIPGKSIFLFAAYNAQKRINYNFFLCSRCKCVANFNCSKIAIEKNMSISKQRDGEKYDKRSGKTLVKCNNKNAI